MNLLIKKFYEIPRENVPLTILHALFVEETHVKCSYSYFQKVSGKITTIKTKRTGAAEIKLSKLSTVIAERAFHGVNMMNTISIDEKPFIPKNFLPKSQRVLKDHKGPIYTTLFHALQKKPFYIVCAVSWRGVICCKIFDDPIQTDDFVSFLVHLVCNHRAKYKQFLIFDNASFHKVSDETKMLLGELDFSISKTPPSGCFTDPIEEYFAILDKEFKTQLYTFIVRGGHVNAIKRDDVKKIIESSLDASSKTLIRQFRRALL